MIATIATRGPLCLFVWKMLCSLLIQIVSGAVCNQFCFVDLLAGGEVSGDCGCSHWAGAPTAGVAL